jgi:hypothetical protein
MFLKNCSLCFLVGLILIPACPAVQLRLKFQKDKVESNEVNAHIQGDLKVDGTQRLEGTASGDMGVKMTQKTLSIDEKGVATVDMKLDGLSVKMNSEADMGQGKKKYGLNLTENGGKAMIDGATEEIPPMADVKAQSWQVHMDNLGAPVSFSLDSSQMGSEEAKEVQSLSDSVASIVSKHAPLPEQDVKVGDTWENVLSIKELTSTLSKDNPMLSAFANLGIDDVKTVSTLKEIRTEGGNEIATISSVTNFAWKEGKIPLGVINITVKNLEVKSEALVDMNNTLGQLSRTSAITTMAFDITVETALGPEGPSNYMATGNLKMESTTTIK